MDNSWGNNSIYTFVEIENGADINAVNKKLTDIVVENNPQITTNLVFSHYWIFIYTDSLVLKKPGVLLLWYIFLL